MSVLLPIYTSPLARARHSEKAAVDAAARLFSAQTLPTASHCSPVSRNYQIRGWNCNL